MKKIFLNGLIDENPVLILLLGLCSTLAVTTTFEGAYIMGLSVLFILVLTNTIIALIKSFIPDTIRIPSYILIISTLVTIVDLLLTRYAPTVRTSLGIYLPLIIVNCLILGRALNFASKNKVLASVVDALGMGLGFLGSLLIIALLRELLGNNSLTIVNSLSNLLSVKIVFKDIFPSLSFFPISILITPAGGFIILGLILGIVNTFKTKKESGEPNESN